MTGYVENLAIAEENLSFLATPPARSPHRKSVRLALRSVHNFLLSKQRMNVEIFEAISIFRATLPDYLEGGFRALEAQIEFYVRDVENCAREVEQKLSAAEKKTIELATEIYRLKEGRRKNRKERYAPRSEAAKFHAGQPKDEGNEASSAEAESSGSLATEKHGLNKESVLEKKSSAGRQKKEKPQHLNNRDRYTYHPGACSCPECGHGVRSAGLRTTVRVSATVKYQKVNEHYERIECRNCTWAEDAPRRFLANQCDYDTSFLASAIEDKFITGVPYYRQEQSWRSSGIGITDTAICRQVNKAANFLRPLVEKMHIELKEKSMISIDETRIPYFDARTEKFSNGACWALTNLSRISDHDNPKIILFRFSKQKRIEDARFILDCSPEILVSDANPIYSEKSSPGSAHGKCNAHARRRFWDAKIVSPSEAADDIIYLYGKLYAVEREAAWKSSKDRLNARRKFSVPIFEKLAAKIRSLKDIVDPKSVLGDAVSYFLKHQDGLSMFLRRGEVEIDNNPVERAIRRIAIIRKASLHAGSEGGAHAWMLFSSLVATCEANDVDPRRYLHWLLFVFDRSRIDLNKSLDERVNGIMPWDFGRLEREGTSSHRQLMARIIL